MDADESGVEALRDDPQIKSNDNVITFSCEREPLVLKAELQYGDETFEITPKVLQD